MRKSWLGLSWVALLMIGVLGNDANGAANGDVKNDAQSLPAATNVALSQPTPGRGAFSLGFALDRQVFEAFDAAPSWGLGGVIRWEMMARENTVIGADFILKRRLGDLGMIPFGYGFFLKHYLTGDLKAFEAESRWYLMYGLKYLSTSIRGKENSALAHDTQFALGAEFLPFSWGSFFGELSYHFSRLRYLDLPVESLDHVELMLGARVIRW